MKVPFKINNQTTLAERQSKAKYNLKNDIKWGKSNEKLQTIFKEWGIKQKFRKSNETELKFQRVEKKRLAFVGGHY